MRKGVDINISKDPSTVVLNRKYQQEVDKRHQINMKKEQVDRNLLMLRHLQSELKELVEKTVQDPEFNDNYKLLGQRNVHLLDLYSQYKSLRNKKLEILTSEIQVEQKLVQEEFNSSFKDQQLAILSLLQESLTHKLSRMQQEYHQIQQSVQTINQELLKRDRRSDLAEQVAQVIQLLKSQYNQEISQEDLYLLQSFDLNTFNLSCNEEIIQSKKRIQTLRMSIMHLKDRYFKIDIELKGKGNTEQQLNQQLAKHEQLSSQLNHLKNGNEFLHSNMDQQVQRIVKQKANLINQHSYDHVNKYIKASEYLIEKLGGGLLQKQQLEQIMTMIEQVKQSASQKITEGY